MARDEGQGEIRVVARTTRNAVNGAQGVQLRLGLLALCALLFQSLAGDVSAVAPPSGSREPAKIAMAAHQRLIGRIAQRGSARVIVGLRSDDEPLAGLRGRQIRKAELRTQRARAVGRLQDRLIGRLPKKLNKKIKRLKNIPYVILDVDVALLEHLGSAPGVASIHEDILFRPALFDSARQIGADFAWDAGFTGEGKVIALLDTGVDTSHPALAGKIVNEACFSTNSFAQNTFSLCPNGSERQIGAGAAGVCTGDVECEHGTHVSGIAVGEDPDYAGIARSARLLPVQVFSRIDDALACAPDTACLAAYFSDILLALEWIYEQRDKHDFAVVNLSLGGDTHTSESDCNATYPQIRAVIDDLRSEGVATVAAAGNDFESSAISAPACLSGAISVGAVNGDDEVSVSSNSADFLDLLAPGVSVVSSVPGGGFDTKTGTSMASPHVAGAVAMLADAVPHAGVAEIEDALVSSGVAVTDQFTGVVTPRIAVDSALKALATGDLAEIDLTLERVLTGLNRPVVIGHAGDNSGRLFIGLESGRIRISDGTQLVPGPFVNLKNEVDCCGDGGLRGFAFHPDYRNDQRLFVSYVDSLGDLVISSLEVSSDPNRIRRGSQRRILTVPGPLAGSPGGDIQFGPDGYLYIAVGGAGDDPQSAAAGDLGSWYGKILRIDVDTGGAQAFRVPPDNPFVGAGFGTLAEIWATGLRNPTQLVFDRLRGDLFVTDNGGSTFEEVNYQAADSSGGEDYGWPVMEGNQCRAAGCNKSGLMLPIAKYTRNRGCAISGGRVYRGHVYPELRGVFLYGDRCSGRIWGLAGDRTDRDIAVLRQTGLAIQTFGTDEQGNIYIADEVSGDLYLLKQGVHLRPGITRTGRFGHRYGRIDRGASFVVSFDGTNSDLSLTLNGFDIDSPYEVAVHLNDSLLGYLTPGPNQALNAGDRFTITAAQQLPGHNELRFTQVGNPIWTWGVTNLRLETFATPAGTADVVLTPGVPDTGAYGHQFGSNRHLTEVVVAFAGRDRDRQLSVTGYDVDQDDEIAVYLNDTLIGFLRAGPNNRLNAGDTFVIPAGLQVAGQNRVAFRQTKQAGFKWGVRDLVLTRYRIPPGRPDLTLTIGDVDDGAYGHRFGSDRHVASLVAAFEGTAQDLRLSVSGYDIDQDDEVAVYVNAALVGFLSAGPDRALNAGDSFVIPAGMQVQGQNRINFRQVAEVGFTWGVTEIELARVR